MENNTTRLAFLFEDFCAELFTQYGFKVLQNSRIKSESFYREIDLTISKGKDFKAIIEIKSYRTRKASLPMLEKAIKQLLALSQLTQINNLILIVSSTVDNKVKEALSSEYGIVIIDSKNLLYLINGHNALTEQYLSIINDIPNEICDKESTEPINLDSVFNIKVSTSKISESKLTQEEIELFNRLSNITCGREDFAKFEDVCTDILKYLFDEYLTGWYEQLKTTDDLNRYDLICRIKNGNDFWEFLKSEFNSRYIIFEFKNYCKPVKQTQIYTTEKYMFKTALRNVCFMISQHGADKNALKATSGILRESGKLIIHLDKNDLIEMLKLKNTGSEPSDYLFDLVDQFLLTLSK